MSDEKILKVNPIIDKLSKVTGRDSAVELQGYVGPSEPDEIRLYTSLSMTHYVEFPKDSLLHAVEIKDDDTGQVRLYVAGSTQLRLTSVHVASVSADKLERLDSSACRCSPKVARNRTRGDGWDLPESRAKERIMAMRRRSGSFSSRGDCYGVCFTDFINCWETAKSDHDRLTCKWVWDVCTGMCDFDSILGRGAIMA